MSKVTMHKDGTVSIDGVRVGFWTRHYNGKVDRGVALGGWQGCFDGGRDSPIFSLRVDLKLWFLRNSLGRAQ